MAARYEVTASKYRVFGFDIWDFYQRNPVTQAMLATKGPVVFNVSQQEMNPRSFRIHQAAEWKNVSGDRSITLNRPSNSNIIFYIMVK